ncbi:hypothetical protein Tsubulata_009367 [Turnera subulata]|uniref:non-specific serine/threonine protein kinase n=1 Tax=Turnera subulata TaxID=218843 RepID=A0A9Q0GFS7_9ROSI|nr:hypothetical protein Tsubulata_009367 [Turnera subulata]
MVPSTLPQLLGLHSIILILLASVSFSRVDYEGYSECKKPFNCGLLQNLSYPFWGGNRHLYCGHIAFRLACQAGQYPSIFGDGEPEQFRLMLVDPNRKVMTLALIKPEEYICPQNPENKTLNPSFLSLPGSNLRTLDLFYGCTESMHPPGTEIKGCQGWGRSYFGFERWPTDSGHYPPTCNATIRIPVPVDVVDGLDKGGMPAVEGLLREGYNLSYLHGRAATICQECTSSGGVCGTNASDPTGFLCLCRGNSSTPDVCKRGAYEDTRPTPLHNVSLDLTPFDISPGHNTDLFFLYNCTSKPEYFTYPVNCACNAGNYCFAGFHLELYNYSLKSCKYFVNAPVRAVNDVGTLIGMNYADVLKMGFFLGWSAYNCSTCERSGDRCGFEDNDFLCYCRGGPRLQSCVLLNTTIILTSRKPKFCDVIIIILTPHCFFLLLRTGGDWTVGRKIAIGVAASVGAALVLFSGFLIWYRRKKKQYPPSRSFPSDPSSKSDIEEGSQFNGVHLFTYEELEAATNNFDSAKELGEGAFGTVYYGQLHDGRAVAVKRLNENNYNGVGQFMNEVDILTRLRHPHLVSLYGCTSRSSRELLLVYEYVANGTVADHLHGQKAKPGGLPWTIRMNIAVETASALAYLHRSDIIHRDVKTKNILLDTNFCVKVADFGLSRLFPSDVTHVSTAPQGTPGYVDPEYHECYQLTSKSDVYSFGVVLVELISSMPAVDITRHRQDINLSNMAIIKIQSDALNELVDPTLGFESDCAVRKMVKAVAELAFRCLQRAKDMRPPMDEVLEVLKEIQNTDYDMAEGEDMDMDAPLSDTVGLLNSAPLQPSPDNVV